MLKVLEKGSLTRKICVVLGTRPGIIKLAIYKLIVPFYNIEPGNISSGDTHETYLVTINVNNRLCREIIDAVNTVDGKFNPVFNADLLCINKGYLEYFVAVNQGLQTQSQLVFIILQ